MQKKTLYKNFISLISFAVLVLFFLVVCAGGALPLSKAKARQRVSGVRHCNRCKQRPNKSLLFFYFRNKTPNFALSCFVNSALLSIYLRSYISLLFTHFTGRSES